MSGNCIDPVRVAGYTDATGLSITISADDPRSIYAIEIAADASRWRVWRDADGHEVYRVPSQTRPDRLYLVTQSTCTCPDYVHASDDPFEEDRACKHILAVRLYCELVRAQQLMPRNAPEQPRGRLRLVR
jgi:hypothetical protein